MFSIYSFYCPIIFIFSIVLISCEDSVKLGRDKEVEPCFRCLSWDHPSRKSDWIDGAWHMNPSAVAVHSASGRLATTIIGRPRNEIEVLDLSTGRLTLIRHAERVYQLSDPVFDPTGQRIAFIAAPPIYSGVSEVIILDLESSTIVTRIGGGTRYFKSLVFSYDGSDLFLLANESAHYDSPYGAYPEYRELHMLSVYRYNLKNKSIKQEIPYFTNTAEIYYQNSAGLSHARLVGVYNSSDPPAHLHVAEICAPPARDFNRCTGDYLIGDNTLQLIAPLGFPGRLILIEADGRAFLGRPPDAQQQSSFIESCTFYNGQFVDCESIIEVGIGSFIGIDIWSKKIVSGYVSVEKIKNPLALIKLSEHSPNTSFAIWTEIPEYTRIIEVE